MNGIGLVFLAAGSLLATDPSDDPVAKEIEKFQGTWKFVSIEAEGVKMEADDFKKSRLIIKGDRFTFKTEQGSGAGTFKVDLAQKPKKIDVTFTDGPEKGKTAQGIYELEGDTYKVCIALAGKERPTTFASKPNSGHVLEVLQREKP